MPEEISLHIGGQSRNYIAASKNNNGDATAWNPNTSSPVNTLGINGSSLYAGGEFYTIDGQERNRIAAIDINNRECNRLESNC